MVSQTFVDELESGYIKLQTTTDDQCHSLLKKHLTRQVFEKLKHRRTRQGATLLDVVRSGFVNLDSTIGSYAPDADAYTVFAELFDPIISECHLGFQRDRGQPAVHFGDVSSLVDVDPGANYVISTRIRCGRNLDGFPFPPLLSKAQYRELESTTAKALQELQDDLSGTYHCLCDIPQATQTQMAKDHFLFGSGDRFLEAANACSHWPTGRGIYCNDAKTFLVWVNEEDGLRVISMQPGGDVRAVYDRFVRALGQLEMSGLTFAHSEGLGFLTTCPSNLGTAIRASVLVRLPLLGRSEARLKKVARHYKLQVRGTNGENSESVEGVYDISNIRRLGLTEYEAVREMQDGIIALIGLEKALESVAGDNNNNKSVQSW